MRVPCLCALLLLAAGERSASLEELVRTGVLTPEQAAKIIEETGAESVPADYTILGLVSGSTLLALLGCMALALLFLYTIPWAVSRGPAVCIALSGVFGVVFYGAGLALVSQGSGFLASTLLIMTYMAWMSCVFSVLTALGLASFSDIDQGAKMQMPTFQVWVSLVLSYLIARSCSFVMTQLPFFLSLYVAAERVGSSKLLAEKSQPTAKFVFLSASGVFLLFYTHWVGPNAFLAGAETLSDQSDFQVMAYVSGTLLFWHAFTGLVEVTEGRLHDVLLWLRVPVAVGMLLFGFRVPCAAVIFFSMKWLSDELAAASASESLLPGALFVTPLVYLFLISNYSLQLVSDIFAPQARQYLADSFLWSVLCYVLTVFTSLSALLFSLGISNVNVEKVTGDATHEHVEILWGRVAYKFFLCYTLTLLLVLLAEYETSWLVSLAYLVFAVISYWKVLGLLLVSDPNESMLAVLFFSGQRITLVGSGFWTCFLLGSVLMSASLIFLSLRAKDSRWTYVLSLFLQACFLVTALITESILLFSASILLSLQVVSVRLSAAQMKVTMSIFALLLALYLAEVWSFAALSSRLSRTSMLKRIITAVSDPSVLVPEKEVTRRIFLGVRDWLLELSAGA